MPDDEKKLDSPMGRLYNATELTEADEKILDAYKLAALKLPELAHLDSNFTLVNSPDRAQDAVSKNAWYISTDLAWGLRVADSQGHKELTENIKGALENNPKMKFYVAYQLFTDSYTTEEDNSDVIKLNPISDQLQEYAVSATLDYLSQTDLNDINLTMFDALLQRMRFWHTRGIPITLANANRAHILKFVAKIEEKMQTEPYSVTPQISAFSRSLQSATSLDPDIKK